MASLGLAPDGHGTIHAEGGQHKRLAGWPLICAIAIGHLERKGLRLGKLILTPDTTKGGINVHLAALQAKPRGHSGGTGGEESHGAKGVEASEDTPRGIVVQGRAPPGLA